MIGKLATLIGYTKAPKTTFVVRHPVKGAKALVAAKGAKALLTTRSGLALSALIAVPVGALLVQRMTS